MSEKKDTKKDIIAEMKQSGNKNTAAVIYLGPAIAGVAMPGTVYRNGLPPLLQKVKDEQPALDRLLVSIKDTAQIRKDLKNPQSAASICYQKVLEYANKKGAEG